MFEDNEFIKRKKYNEQCHLKLVIGNVVTKSDYSTNKKSY